MRLLNRRVALVGGAGFIGHHLAMRLAAEGAEVHVIDNLYQYTRTDRGALSPLGALICQERRVLLQRSNVHLHRLDGSESGLLVDLLRQIEAEVVVHLAAVASSEQTDLHPALAVRSVLQTLGNSLEYSKDRVQRFVYFSSSMVYGNFLSAEADENHPTAPVNLYGAIKLAAEWLVITCGETSHLPWTIFRPSAVYGPRCLKGSVIERLLTQAMFGEPLTITGDGSTLLDFTYIDDVVNGTCLALCSSNAIREIFNLTFGCSRAISDVVEVIRGYFPSIAVECHLEKASKPRRGTLRIDKARQLLGYCPEYTLEKGISNYISWMQTVYGRPAGARIAGMRS